MSAAKLEELRDAVLEATQWTALGGKNFPNAQDWRAIKRLARDARCEPVSQDDVLRKAVLDAEQRTPKDGLPMHLDWHEIKKLARAARAPAPSIFDGMSPEAREAAERYLNALVSWHRGEDPNGWRALTDSQKAFLESVVCPRRRRARPPCTFRRNHPGACSWDVQVEEIHHATGKPKRKGARG